MSEKIDLGENNLIIDNKGLVYSVIRKYYPTYAHDEDIISSGMVGLCRAANTWDETKSVFSTYAFTCIRNEIRLELRLRAKQPPDTLSIDYEINGDDNSLTTFGELLVGDSDIDYMDIETISNLFTPIEYAIFEMKYKGLKSKEIAQAVGVGAEQIRRYLRRIKKKLKEYEDETDI